jgi:hypothetical protein
MGQPSNVGVLLEEFESLSESENEVVAGPISAIEADIQKDILENPVEDEEPSSEAAE